MLELIFKLSPSVLIFSLPLWLSFGVNGLKINLQSSFC